MKTPAGGPHQDWLGLLQGPEENGIDAMLLLVIWQKVVQVQTGQRVVGDVTSRDKETSECNSTPPCYLYAAKEDKPRTVHLPGTMRRAALTEEETVRI